MVFCPLMFGSFLVVGVFNFKSSICLNQKLLLAALEDHLFCKAVAEIQLSSPKFKFLFFEF